MILNWDRSINTDKAVDFNRPDTVLTERENKTALVIARAVPLTPNLPTAEVEKMMKFENLNLEIKNIWKLSNVAIYPSVIPVEKVVTKNFLKYL